MIKKFNYRSLKFNEGNTVSEAKKLLDKGIPISVFDVETDGLAKESNHILSFSAVKLIKNGNSLEEIARIDQFINPGCPIPKRITEINHISDETVKNCPNEQEAANIIRQFLGDNPFVCGFNSISFDEGFVNAMYQRAFEEAFQPCLHLDVYRMAKEKLKLQSYKLEHVSKQLGADEGIEYHNSIDDVVATARVLEKLLEMYREEEYISVVPTIRASITSVKYWESSDRNIQRIYVNTVPRSTTFFDLGRKELVSDENFDMESLKKEIFQRCNVTTEEALFQHFSCR